MLQNFPQQGPTWLGRQILTPTQDHSLQRSSKTIGFFARKIFFIHHSYVADTFFEAIGNRRLNGLKANFF